MFDKPNNFNIYRGIFIDVSSNTHSSTKYSNIR